MSFSSTLVCNIHFKQICPSQNSRFVPSNSFTIIYLHRCHHKVPVPMTKRKETEKEKKKRKWGIISSFSWLPFPSPWTAVTTRSKPPSSPAYLHNSSSLTSLLLTLDSFLSILHKENSHNSIFKLEDSFVKHICRLILCKKILVASNWSKNGNQTSKSYNSASLPTCKVNEFSFFF